MRRDDGVAVIWSLALMSVLMLAGALSAGVWAQASARLHAGSVADVAALAAAQAPDTPCAQAERVAQANGVSVAACDLDGSDVVVTVSEPPPAFTTRLLGLLGRAAPEITATARAGPP